MRKYLRALSLLLSLVLVFSLCPQTVRAGAAADGNDVSIVVKNLDFNGGFENGTYENVASVWEAGYYDVHTNQFYCADSLEDTSTDDHTNRVSVNYATVSRTPPTVDLTPSSEKEDASGRDTQAFWNTGKAAEEDPHQDDIYSTSNEKEGWFWHPMYLAKADEDGLHRITVYYAELTGLSETGHAAAKNFEGKWGVINYEGDIVCKFESKKLEDVDGFTESGPTGARTEKGEPIVVRRDTSKRSYRNGYLVVSDTDKRSELMDQDEQACLPADINYEKLSDVSNTGVFWAGDDTHIFAVLKIRTEEKDKPIVPGPGYDPSLEEYIYDVADPCEDLVLPTDELDQITDTGSAVDAVKNMVDGLTNEQRESATGIDLSTLYAETAVMRAATKAVEKDAVLINAGSVRDLQLIASRTAAATEQALTEKGIHTARILSSTAVFTSDESDITIRIDPDILTVELDQVRVETPTFALTFKLKDLEEDLTQSLTFTAADVGAGYAPAKTKGKTGQKAVVKVNIPNGKVSNPITVSTPKEKGSKTYQAVVSTSGTETASKYNPATNLMDGKVSTSGSYTVKTNEKDFSDIANKSAEMQKAIRYLASKGIIKGTTETTFSPNGSISRAEIAQLIVKALGKLDSSAAANFTDVPRGSWYYSAAASSQKQGYIKGYEDKTFRGPSTINRVQIVAVSSRVLEKQMGYKAPGNPASYLSKYSDRVDFWAQSDVALATRENLVVYRKDRAFSGAKNMTRGDAAIIIYRLFQKLW